MRRLLLIPAAGLGSRLGAGLPKLLVPVRGTPMVDRLHELYAHEVTHTVIVVHPSFEREVKAHVAGWGTPVTAVVQERPTGMLDALMLASDAVRRERPEQVWITWCDQVGVHSGTVQRLVEAAGHNPDAAIVMPTVRRVAPYIHLARDAQGRISSVLHRREGDAMPEEGESDMGVFSLSARAYLDLLPRYAEQVVIGAVTHERNFLPFIAWVSRHHAVMTFPPVDEAEAVGVNTPDELAFVERLLAARAAEGVSR